MKIITVMILSIVLTVTSCGKPDCANTNSIFNDYKPEQIEYKEEIIRLMEANYDGIDFWFDRYGKKESGEFIEVQISGEGICANALIIVTDWRKMEGIQRTQGVSYGGAKLVGLKFILEKDSANKYFLNKGLDKIVD